jgi:hypothetical protein
VSLELRQINKPISGGSTDWDLTVEESSLAVVEAEYLLSLHVKKKVTFRLCPSTVELYVTDP